MIPFCLEEVIFYIENKDFANQKTLRIFYE